MDVKLTISGFSIGFLLWVAAAVGAPNEAPLVRYSSSSYPWSVSYPSTWRVREQSSQFVLFGDPMSMCGVHTRRVRFETVDELADVILADVARRALEQRGLKTELVSRSRIELPNDIVGVDVTVNLVLGGRSRRVFALVDEHAYVVDCETMSVLWETWEPDFDRFIRSLTIERRTVHESSGDLP